MATESSTDGTFGDRFLARSASLGRLCVGIDPHAGLLEAWGLPVSVDGLRTFTRICVEAFADTACVVKPQVAFYEAFGSAGFAVLEDALASLRAAGTLVIADAKRGDIGSTMAGYATAWLGTESPLCADAVTVSPYLGFGSLEPVIEAGERTGRGVIVLAATSNPSGPQFQQLSTGDAGVGPTVAQTVVDRVAECNAAHVASGGAGNLGVVVGATVTDPPVLDAVGGLILMPGVGAQGGTPADIARIAGAAENLASPNISRAILAAGPDIGVLRTAVADSAAQFPQISYGH
ncbi:orotidine-5'-phosphate decarboxylase [Corynebacterium terpenotabidum]|uniref:Orotidine 5'-phosphate decarboxylase n=1 Tax=Corynebacterium terpenotabidum Y-11 TaxID=1200352 RepID=S4XJT9_9CORY|nr:orotidine-5'-phosphate decarboxylase [Corynebacterium terpenotabidum]AGP30833.1 orotidine 5'-phosphate decarboxylase [Corynebacterium terpenotabidum Y-11]